MEVAFPREPAEYRAARVRLLAQEVELRRMTEAVAAARRALPPGGRADDYVFHGGGENGTPTDVRLSELFAPGRDSLVLYSFMFPRDPGDERPAPEAGQTALLRLRKVRVRHAWPCSISSTAPRSTPARESTSL